MSSQMGFFATSETSQKKSYSENSTMTCLEQRNPRIQALIPNVMKPTQEKIEKIDQRPRIQPLEGATSFTLHK